MTGRLGDVIVTASIDVAVLACALCGYCLLRAVSKSRIPAIIESTLFIVSMVGSAFIAPLLMYVSKAFWPDCFRGEQGLNYCSAPIYAALLSLVLLLFFLVGLFFCRPHQDSADAKKLGLAQDLAIVLTNCSCQWCWWPLDQKPENVPKLGKPEISDRDCRLVRGNGTR